MNRISQRELHNDTAEIVRAVEAGERFVVTRRGVPVASIGPVEGTETDGDLRCTTLATTTFSGDRLRRVRATEPTSTTIDELRGER